MKVVFVRHTSVAVPKGVCYGRSDVPLADTFVSEAESVRRRLVGYSFDRVYSSPLSRCAKLAAFCGFGNPVFDSRLMEMDFGEWEMMAYDEIADPCLQLWYADFLNVRPTGGESSMEQRERFLSFIADLRAAAGPEECVAVFTHGGIMIHALVALCGRSYGDVFANPPGFGAVVEVEI